MPYFWAGSKLYDIFAGSQRLESSYFLSKSKALEKFPMLSSDSLVGAMVYYDGAHNDSRTNIALALTAATYGATVANHVEVRSMPCIWNSPANIPTPLSRLLILFVLVSLTRVAKKKRSCPGLVISCTTASSSS